MKKSLLILPLALSLVLASCGEREETPTTEGSDATTTQVNPSSDTSSSGSTSTSSSTVSPKVESVTLDETSISIDAYTSETKILTATVTVSGGAAQTVTWTSDNPSIASVNNGTVIAVSYGSTYVRATSTVDPLKSAYCLVTVTDSNPAKNHVAKVKLGENSPVTLSAMKEAPEGDGGLYQYTAKLNVTAGQALSFIFDNEEVHPGDGNDGIQPHNGNNTFGSHPNYVVHNDVNNADLYFKVYESGYSFWLTGYDSSAPDPVPPEPVHTATVQFGTGTPINMTLMDNPPEGDGGLYQFEATSIVSAGAAITFTLDGVANQPGADAGSNSVGEYPNYTVHNDAESVKVYFKVFESGTSFWIGGYEEIHTATVKFGDAAAVDLGLMENPPEGEGGLYQFVSNFSNVYGGDAITFTLDGDPISPYADGGLNNVFGAYPDYTVHNDAEVANVYLKVYETGVSFWIDGYEEDPITATVKFGEATPIDMTLMDNPPEGDGGLFQFEAETSVNAGDAIAFTLNGSAVEAGPSEGSNSIGEHPNYTVHNDASSVKVYFKIYESGLSFWIGGYEDVPYLAASYDGVVHTDTKIDLSKLVINLVDGETVTSIIDDASCSYKGTLIDWDTLTFPKVGFYTIDISYEYNTQYYHTTLTLQIVGDFGYSLLINSDTTVRLEPDGTDSKGRPQHRALAVDFTKDDTIKIMNTYDESKFICDLDTTSFDGVFSDYLYRDEDCYLVLQDFTASVYFKEDYGKDEIYFGLVDGKIGSAAVSINSGDLLPMEEIDPNPEDPDMIQQFHIRIDAIENDAIQFYADSILVNPGSDRVLGNLKIYDDVIRFFHDFDNCDIYLKVYDNSLDFYATLDNSFYVVSESSSWVKDPAYVMSPILDEAYKEQYAFIWKDMTAGTEFTIYSDRYGFGTDGYLDAIDGILEENEYFDFITDSGESYGNIVCNEDGNYKIFFKINHDDTLSIYIQKLEFVPNSLVVSYNAREVVKGNTLNLNKLNVAFYDYALEYSDVKDTAKYFINESEVDLSTYVFESSGDVTVTVKYEYSESPSKIATTTFVVHVVDQLLVDIFVTASNESNICDWYDDDGCKMFVWACIKDSWVLLDCDCETQIEKRRLRLTIDVDELPSAFVVVRCTGDVVAGVTEWPTGKVTNQSDDYGVECYEGYYYQDVTLYA